MESTTSAIVITTISTLINGDKLYVAKRTHHHSSGNMIIVTHTRKMDEAKRWKRRSQAFDFIAKIVNPCGRTYEVETVVLNPDKPQSLATGVTAPG